MNYVDLTRLDKNKSVKILTKDWCGYNFSKSDIELFDFSFEIGDLVYTKFCQELDNQKKLFEYGDTFYIQYKNIFNQYVKTYEQILNNSYKNHKYFKLLNEFKDQMVAHYLHAALSDSFDNKNHSRLPNNFLEYRIGQWHFLSRINEELFDENKSGSVHYIRGTNGIGKTSFLNSLYNELSNFNKDEIVKYYNEVSIDYGGQVMFIPCNRYYSVEQLLFQNDIVRSSENAFLIFKERYLEILNHSLNNEPNTREILNECRNSLVNLKDDEIFLKNIFSSNGLYEIVEIFKSVLPDNAPLSIIEGLAKSFRDEAKDILLKNRGKSLLEKNLKDPIIEDSIFNLNRNIEEIFTYIPFNKKFSPISTKIFLLFFTQDYIFSLFNKILKSKAFFNNGFPGMIKTQYMQLVRRISQKLDLFEEFLLNISSPDFAIELSCYVNENIFSSFFTHNTSNKYPFSFYLSDYKGKPFEGNFPSGVFNILGISTSILLNTDHYKLSGFIKNVLIDEPDVSLHYEYLIILNDLFNKYSVKFGINVICATHSPFLVSGYKVEFDKNENE